MRMRRGFGRFGGFFYCPSMGGAGEGFGCRGTASDCLESAMPMTRIESS